MQFAQRNHRALGAAHGWPPTNDKDTKICDTPRCRFASVAAYDSIHLLVSFLEAKK